VTSFLAEMLDRRSVENPLRPLTDAALIDVLSAGQRTHSAIAVSETSSVRMIAVYRACSLVAGTIAMLDLEAFSSRPRRNPFRSPLLTKPNADMTSMEFWERVFFAEMLSGNSYNLKTRNGADAVIDLEPLPIGSVTPRRVARSDRNPWGKEFDVRQDSGWPKVLTPWDILHIPGPGYGLAGLSPIGVARQGIGLALAQEEYGARLFGSGSLMAGVLQTDQKLKQEEADAIKARWKERIAGLAKAHEVAVLDAGAKYQPIGIPPEDAQFIEGRKFQVTEIARLYGIPPHMLGDVDKSTSWGTGIEQQTLAYIIFTVGPWMRRAEKRLSDECLPRGIEAEFSTRRLLRGDAKARAEAARTWLQNGVKNFDEIRGEEGYGPRPGGQLYMVPANMTLIGEDGEPVHIGAGGAGTDPDEPAPAPEGDLPDDDGE
jgi:HK97 family phage portal protein